MVCENRRLSVLSLDEMLGDSDWIQLISLAASNCLHGRCNVLTRNLETLSFQVLHGHTGCLSHTLGSNDVGAHGSSACSMALGSSVSGRMVFRKAISRSSTAT